MEIMLFIKHLRNKGALYYQTWMPILIQYNGEDGQAIKLNVTVNVAKSTYYRIIQYGVDVFPNYVKNYSLSKKRNELIIEAYNKLENQIPEIKVVEKKEKTLRQAPVKPTTNESVITEIINFLNECSGKSYKANSKLAVLNINARIKDGYSLDDFKKVITIKSTKWLGTKFEDYLTPNTLFGNKFESYLNENITKEKTKQENAYEQVIKATELGFNR